MKDTGAPGVPTRISAELGTRARAELNNGHRGRRASCPYGDERKNRTT